MPKAAKIVLSLALFAAIGVIFLGPIITTVNGNTGTQAVTNETFVADSGNYTDLQGYDINENSETVYGYNESSGSFEVASEGSDYEMDYEAGRIKPNSSSTLIDDGEDVKVTYDYQATSGITTLIIGFIPVGVGLFIFVGVANRVQGMM